MVSTIYVLWFLTPLILEKDSDAIGLHLRNIYKSGELTEEATTGKYSVVQKVGTRNVTWNLKLYNLYAIISVGYRVNSKRGVQFRLWANQVIKDFLIKGYALNEKRLKTQNEHLISLKESVLILTRIVNQTKLSSDESEGLLKIITDYAYALEGNASSHLFRKILVNRVLKLNNYSNEAVILLMELFSHSSPVITKKYLGICEKEIHDVYDSLRFSLL